MLTGCAATVTGTAAPGSTVAAGTTSTSGSPAGSAPAIEDSVVTETPRSSAPGLDTGVAKFGQTFQWTDGLEVTVSPASPFTPSKFAVSSPAASYLGFTISVFNNSDEPYDPVLFRATAQSGTTEASTVFDPDNNFNDSPSTSVLPGRTSTFLMGYGVSDPSDVVMEVSPGVEYRSVLFSTDGVAAEPTAEPTDETGASGLISGTGPGKFGTTFTWTDGLEIEVSPGTPVTPSPTSSNQPAAAYLSFTVKITNKTGQPFDPYWVMVTAQSGSTDGSILMDRDNGLTALPSTSVLDGRDLTYAVGFGVADPATTVVSVRPHLSYDAAEFAN
jgi:hypothetical protein